MKKYYINYRQLDSEDGPQDYYVRTATHGPFILEGLQSDSRYEVFLEALNAHGPGEPSNRVVFATKSQLEETQIDPRTAVYVNRDLAEYLVPTAADAGAMEAIIVPDKHERRLRWNMSATLSIDSFVDDQGK